MLKKTADQKMQQLKKLLLLVSRSSLIDAISIKRDNVGVVDAITAEDIGKFA